MDSELAQRYPKLAQACAEVPARFPAQTAARHARLLSGLEAAWGTRDAADRLDELLFSDRPDRQGFDRAVMAELVALRDLHEQRHPELVDPPSDAYAVTELVVARTERRSRGAASKRGRAYRKPAAAAAPATASDEGAAPCAWPTLDHVHQLEGLVERRRGGETAPERDGRKLLEILMAHGRVDHQARGRAVSAYLKSDRRQPLGRRLLDAGAVAEQDLTRALCLQSGIPIVDLRAFDIAEDTMKLVPAEVARGKRAVPVAAMGGVLFLAVDNPLVFAEREYFGFLTNHRIETVMAVAEDIDLRLADYGQARRSADEEFRNLAQKALAPLASAAVFEVEEAAASAISQEDATVVGLVNKMIMDAADNGVSDIHIERFPGNDSVQIRMRHDGRLESYSQYPCAYHDALVSRVKIVAGLDITERRRPQDGNISFSRPGKGRLDLRVATIPTLRGIAPSSACSTAASRCRSPRWAWEAATAISSAA